MKAKPRKVLPGLLTCSGAERYYLRYMNPRIGIFLLMLISSLNSNAQNSHEMIARGKVTDVVTSKGIRANIRYSSIPTGSIYGNFNDSTYSFTIFGTARYEVTVEAKGYSPKTVIVDPREMNEEHRIERNIRLVPNGQTIRLDRLIFEQGKSRISETSFDELDEVALMMTENQEMIIQLEGHTDNVGSSTANMLLSEERVEAVKAYLVGKGIGKNRVKTKAFGGSRPLKNELTQEARALNRRVEMRILKN